MQHKSIASDYECPDWYGHIQAAKYLGVSPWDLLKAPAGTWWRDRAFLSMTAEGEARKIISDLKQ